jgi:holo-[acyl-carrier protein] synthase
LAVRFAAKEAASKALGVGVRTLWRHGIGWHEAEVVNDPYGKPTLYLYGYAAQLAQALGLRQWALSLAHEREFAIAFVVAMP